MISRARKNRGYARAWGIDVLKEDSGNDQETVMVCSKIPNSDPNPN